MDHRDTDLQAAAEAAKSDATLAAEVISAILVITGVAFTVLAFIGHVSQF